MNTIKMEHRFVPASALEMPPKKDCSLVLCRDSGGAFDGKPFRAGLLALVYPNTGYSLTMDSDGTLYSIDFFPSFLPEPLRQEGRDGCCLLPEPCEEIFAYYMATWSILQKTLSRIPQYTLESSLCALLSWVTALGREAPMPMISTHSLQLVEQAKAILHGEYSTDLTLQSVAERLFVNPCYLSTIFHQAMGCTFRSYLINLRLQQARRLLTESNFLITDIAMQTGWGSTAYLISSFRKAYGITPNAYRSLHAKPR